MTVRTRAQLNSDADTNINDNSTRDISASDVRSSVKNLADSMAMDADRAMVLLSSGLITSGTNLDLALSSSHDVFKIILSELDPATDNATLRMFFSFDSGSSYASTGYNYAGKGINASGTDTASGTMCALSATSISVTDAIATSSSVGNLVDMMISSAGAGGVKNATAIWQVSSLSTANYFWRSMVAQYANTLRLTNVRFNWSSGDFERCRYKVIGLK